MHHIPFWLVSLMAGVLGLIVGSFLNVVIWRVPRSESLLKPGSHCPECDQPIKPYDDIPVLSWILLKGRCRRCSHKISARYPLVEVAGGLLFLLPVLILGWRVQVAAYMLLGAGLLALSIIDLEHKRLPSSIVYVLGASQVLILAAAALYYQQPQRLTWALIGALWVGVLFGFMRLITHGRGLGLGDVRLAFVLGFSCGWLGLSVPVVWLLLTAAGGSLGGLLLMIAGKISRRSRIPFGPYMALGAEAAVLWGPDVVRWWYSLGGVH